MTQATLLNPRVPYRIDVVYRGERNVKFAWSRQQMPVSIAHAARGDFTEAVVISDFSAGRLGRAAAATLHAHDGCLWTPVVRTDGSDVDVGAFRAMVEEEADLRRPDGLRHSNPFKLMFPSVRTDIPVREFHRPSNDRNDRGPTSIAETRKVVGSGEDEARADADRIAQALRIVDGKVWFRCHDPYWHSYEGKAVLTFGPESEMLTHGHNGRAPDQFRVDRLDDMKGWREGYRKENPGFAKPAITEVVGSADIVDGSCFTRDDLKYMMYGFKSLVDGAFVFMQQAPAPIVAKWAEVRDRAEALQRTWSRGTAMEALEGFQEVWSGCNASKSLGYGFGWDEWKKARRDWVNRGHEWLALARWCDGHEPGLDRLTDEDVAVIEAFAPPGP